MWGGRAEAERAVGGGGSSEAWPFPAGLRNSQRGHVGRGDLSTRVRPSLGCVEGQGLVLDCKSLEGRRLGRSTPLPLPRAPVPTRFVKGTRHLI